MTNKLHYVYNGRMKTCIKCNVSRPLEEFAWRNKEQNKRTTYCKVCRKEYDRAAWKSGSRKNNNYANKVKRINVNKEYVWSVLSASSCLDCGESNPIVLEFDHVRGEKIDNVSTMMHDRCSLTKIKEEIAKCEVVCANCHKIRTTTRAGHWRYGRMAE